MTVSRSGDGSLDTAQGLNRADAIASVSHGAISALPVALSVAALFGQGWVTASALACLAAVVVALACVVRGGRVRWFGAGLGAGLLAILLTLTTGLLLLLFALHGLPTLLS
jgi:hypothetical protein